MIRIEAGMPTTRFCALIGMPERSWRCGSSAVPSPAPARGPARQYVNFPGLYEDNDAMVRGAFGQNLGRLTAIKKQYDPTNLFRLNHNIVLGQ